MEHFKRIMEHFKRIMEEMEKLVSSGPLTDLIEKIDKIEPS